MKTTYVVGFLFNPELTRVALIRKNKPEWQKGKLNGIGGHIESFDCDSTAAMLREFEEEAGAVAVWQSYAIMNSDSWSVACFCATGDLSILQSKTSEQVEIVEVSELKRSECIENLPWLIALAVDFLEDGRPVFTEITYPS